MIIFRYLLKELYAYLLAITLVLLIILITNQFVHYLREVADGKITMLVLMKIMSLQVPLMLGYVLPMGVFLSILLVFGRLYMDHEMTVLAACGMSKTKLLGMSLFFAFVITVVVAWLMIWVEPIMERYQYTLVAESAAEASLAKLVPERFQSLGSRGTFYAEKISQQHTQMYDVFLALRDKTQNNGTQNKMHKKHMKEIIPWDLTIAKVAREKQFPENNSKFLVFQEGDRYVGIPGQDDFKIMHYKQYGIKLVGTLPKVHGWPLTASTAELIQLYDMKSEAAAMLHWRIAIPLSVLILALIAFPLSRVNPRRGKFMQLLPALLIYIVYVDLLFLGRAWIQKDIVPRNVGLWWLHALALLLALILLAHHLQWIRISKCKGNKHHAYP